MADDGQLNQRLLKCGFKQLNLLQDFTSLSAREEKLFHEFLTLQHPLSRDSLLFYFFLVIIAVLVHVFDPPRSWIYTAIAYMIVVALYYGWHRLSLWIYTKKVNDKLLEIKTGMVEGWVSPNPEQLQRLREVSWWFSPIVTIKLKRQRTILVVKSPRDALPMLLEDLDT